jgi:hypothetical protein
MNRRNPSQMNIALNHEPRKRFRFRRRRHNPLLVLNMSIFNSAKVRESIFDSPPQLENVWI